MDVVSLKRDRGCLLKLDISYQVYESMVLCSGVVEIFQGVCTMEMYQLVKLIGVCVLGVPSKLSGMSLA